jgi:septal ring factor EnvC (AmiA/AmiB activator)
LSERARAAVVWALVVVASVAIVLALVAGYFAFTFKSQVSDWESAAAETVSKLESAGIQLQSTVESGVTGYEQEISNLTQQLQHAQTSAGNSQAQLEQTKQQLDAANAQLASTQKKLDETNAELATTQAELDDANAKLEQAGELKLADGTYVGLLLAARTDPVPAVIFQDGTAWRIAEVASDAQISSGGSPLTLDALATLLQSTDPADVHLANGNYKLKVKGGLVVSIQKSKQ